LGRQPVFAGPNPCGCNLILAQLRRLQEAPQRLADNL
jgi:hypothetical protein